MNKEEAIEILSLRKYCNEEIAKALDMAIEALSEPPLKKCTDLINREEAIDAVIKYIWHLPNECYKKFNDREYVSDVVVDALSVGKTKENRIYIKIYDNDEPSVKAEKLYQICDLSESKGVEQYLKEYFPSDDAKWIPCSERLPSEYGEYLATVDGETIEVSYVPTGTPGLIKGWSTCVYDGFKWLSDDDVIAWRPKPKPYKESEDEE